MDKEEARRLFDRETGLLVEKAMEGGNGSVHDMAEHMMNARSPEDLLEALRIIIHADFAPEELNLPADNSLGVLTGALGFRELCAYIYGFGALRYLALSPGQPMGAKMRESLEDTLHAPGDATVQGPIR